MVLLVEFAEKATSVSKVLRMRSCALQALTVPAQKTWSLMVYVLLVTFVILVQLLPTQRKVSVQLARIVWQVQLSQSLVQQATFQTQLVSRNPEKANWMHRVVAFALEASTVQLPASRPPKEIALLATFVLVARPLLLPPNTNVLPVTFARRGTSLHRRAQRGNSKLQQVWRRATSVQQAATVRTRMEPSQLNVQRVTTVPLVPNLRNNFRARKVPTTQAADKAMIVRAFPAKVAGTVAARLVWRRLLAIVMQGTTALEVQA